MNASDNKHLESFTMIELVFIIVILGVLASIAIPRLATSREDAIAVAIKSDIGTILQAVPALYLSLGENFTDIRQAAQLDSARWTDNGASIASTLKNSANTPCAQITYTTAPADNAANAIKAGDRILELTIQDGDSCATLHRMFSQQGGIYSQTLNLSGYGIVF